MTARNEDYGGEGFKDPRVEADFQEGYFPKANGKSAPAPGEEEAEGNQRIILEFLEVYYRLNQAYGRLVMIRNGDEGKTRDLEEHHQLKVVEKAVMARDALEDRLASRGITAEPVVREGFAVDVRFQFGNLDASGQRRTDELEFTCYVSVPLPDGVGKENEGQPSQPADSPK